MIVNILLTMKREWERTILGAMFLLGIIGLFAGSIQFLDFFRRAKIPVAPKVRVKEKYGANSFAFLNPKPHKSLGSNHAMRLQIPQEWENKMRYKEYLRKREAERLRREKARQAAADRMARELEREAATENKPTDDGKNDEAKKPNPQVNHFMVFKGFMKSPGGKLLAYLGKEDVQGDVTKRQGAEFLSKGKDFNGYKVIDIDDEWVQMEDPKGREVMIIRGQRFSYGITKNPDYVLEEEKETDDEGGAKKSKKASSKKKGGNKKGGNKKGNQKTPNQLIQDYLKKSGGKINQKDVQDLLKKNGMNSNDLMKLLNRK